MTCASARDVLDLTVLSVAFPFAPVGPDTVGGAEQVLSQNARWRASGPYLWLLLPE